MHNIKEIRKDFDLFKKLLQNRNIKIDIENIKKLDQINRNLIQKKEKFERFINSINTPINPYLIQESCLIKIFNRYDEDLGVSYSYKKI